MDSFTLYCMIAAALILGVVFTVAYLDGEIDERTLLATPSITKSDASFTSFATIRINASAEDVWAAVLAFQDYPAWNSVLKKSTWEKTTADGVPFVRSKGTIRAALKGFKEHDTRVECTLLDRERKLFAFRGISMPLVLFRTEKVQEIAPVQGEKNVTDYRTWDTVGGLTGLPARYFLKPALDESAKRTAEDLKSYIESKKA